jgi:alpha-1,3-glucosyltransferase
MYRSLIDVTYTKSDPEMLRVDNLDYASPATILFQRATVLLTELLIPIAILLLFPRQSKLLIPLIYLSVYPHPL